MCSGSEAGSYLRLIDFVYHSTLGLRVINKKKRETGSIHQTALKIGRMIYRHLIRKHIASLISSPVGTEKGDQTPFFAIVRVNTRTIFCYRTGDFFTIFAIVRVIFLLQPLDSLYIARNTPIR